MATNLAGSLQDSKDYGIADPLCQVQLQEEGRELPGKAPENYKQPKISTTTADSMLLVGVANTLLKQAALQSRAYFCDAPDCWADGTPSSPEVGVGERQSHQDEAQVATCQTHGMQTYSQLLQPGNLIFDLQQLPLGYGFNVGN